MNINTLLPLILAIVAIVPGVWALVNQANKDRNQSKIDMNTAAQNAAMGIIAPLQTEVARLQADSTRWQARIIELENALIEKTKTIGQLMQEGIDKDAELRTLKYSMLDMQKRLNVFESKRKSTSKTKADVEEETLLIYDEEIAEELKTLEAKKEAIKISTAEEIKEFKSKSITNNINGEIGE